MNLDVKQFTIRRVRGIPEIKKVVLFGSRARGDANERSDYDFAVYVDSMSHGEWSRFVLEIKEKSPTLCGIDLVKMSDKVCGELVKKIDSEGVVIYELGK